MLAGEYPRVEDALPTKSCGASNHSVVCIDYAERASAGGVISWDSISCCRMWLFGQASHDAVVVMVGVFITDIVVCFCKECLVFWGRKGLGNRK